jgi:hypothetical protein
MRSPQGRRAVAAAAPELVSLTFVPAHLAAAASRLWRVKRWTGVEVRQFASREDGTVGAHKSGAAEYLKHPVPPNNRKPLIDSAAFARNQP